MEDKNMNQSTNTFLKKSNKIGFFFVLLVGTLLHFTYEWSGKNPFVGAFCAVNESTWEHMKLLFFPALVYFLVEYAKNASKSRDLLTARTLGLLLGLAFIPISFYTYSGVIGTNYTVIDISIFAVSVFLTFFLSNRFLKKPQHLTAFAAFLILLLLLFLFVAFTFFPPHIRLFLDPVSFTYGSGKY
jgi:hypothetical protein